MEFGCSRSTMREWIKPKSEKRYQRQQPSRTLTAAQWRQRAFSYGASYSYLLGAYLGDGYISDDGRCWRLRITSHRRDVGVKQKLSDAIRTLFPNNRIQTYKRLDRQCDDIGVYSKGLPVLFPQLGIGKKHLREICLNDWQSSIVALNGRSFVSGLIHSDGCRLTRTNQTMPDNVCYKFSNRSEDIISLFEEGLRTLEIPFTRYRRKTQELWDVFVYDQQAAREMDGWIENKRVIHKFYSDSA